MNKHFIFRLISILFLSGMGIGLITCTKNEPLSPNSNAPSAITNSAVWIGRKWATLKGVVNAKNLATSVVFEWGNTTAYGNVISPEPDTMSGNSSISVTATLTGLLPDTKYYYRVKAVSEGGTGTGSDLSFTTTDTAGIVIVFNKDLEYDSITDGEGNKYRTIQIGTQTWMAENLKATKLNDGTDIPFIADVSQWAKLTTPGYCWFNNDSVAYGALYNWYAVSTGKLCPAGWHVPGDAEWTTLTDYLGGADVAGGKLKEAGTSHWLTPNTDATNESGFTALPSGYRNYSGGFYGFGTYGFWWTTTEGSIGFYYRDVFYGYATVDRSTSSQNSGASVRCIKD